MRPYCEIDFPLASDGERLRAAFAEPVDVLLATRPDELAGVLARVEAHARDGRWAVGFVAYEAAGACDAALATRAGQDGLPYAAFAIFRAAAAPPRARGDCLCGAWHDETAPEAFAGGLEAIRRTIAAGGYYQVNYTTRLRAAFLGDSLVLFDGLRRAQPAAYCAYLDFGRWRICSVSPELFFHWRADAGDGRPLVARPMKGTAARDADPARDAAAAEGLRDSPKERAENLMIVDLIRNDLARVARTGSVEVPRLFSLEALPTVWQMTSTVACRTRPDTGLADVFAALFPCGSVTGAPKAAAMAAIAGLERSPRGAYCGAIGVVRPGGEALFSVGIRGVTVDAERGLAECGIGSGITFDSSAAGEHAEWRMKRAFLDAACPAYELLETLCLHEGRYWLRRGHLARLARSAAALGFCHEAARVEAALAAVARAHARGRWRVRLCLAADGAAQAAAHPLEAAPAGGGFAYAAAVVASDNPWLRHKTTRRELYDALAVHHPGVFDTLLHNERGELTEFTRGNLALELDGRLLTPPLACGLLPGVLRAALLRRGRLREAVLTRADAERAAAVWFLNSVRGAVRLTAI